VHMLSSSAFNAFLKTLEEPPPYAIFILATTEKHKILPTILSRCQIFDFKRITTDDTVDHLQEICVKEEVTAEKAALQVIAQKSEGCMRDALSIMDKIVSFTDGQLTYANTLEHLNILDADYYFRLLDSMLTQDLAGAMLLYDEINRKGFEGDLVLNGFAEFVRNLFVCKDEKAAVLLETVENFKDRYIENARKVSTGILISALNILNEAEINYKAARNKRLHVELVLIKLCYLQQAIELSADGNGVSKKKLTDTARPVAFRQLAPMELKQSAPRADNTGARLTIDAPATRKQPVTETAAKTRTNSEAQAETAVATAPVKISALNKIRQQYQGNGNAAADQVNQRLEEEPLITAWFGYIQKLKQAKNPAAQSFQLARLIIRDENSFEVITSNNIEQKFIEQQRNPLFEYLQQQLNNRLLQFNVSITDKPVQQEITDMPLSSKDQFLKLAEQYPLIRELKERLKLELDY
jgi:DNA polymerase III subunit gamma/tau